MQIPIKRSGIETNQTTGQSSNASSASGQHSTPRMNQATRSISVFTELRQTSRHDLDRLQRLRHRQLRRAGQH